MHRSVIAVGVVIALAFVGVGIGLVVRNFTAMNVPSPISLPSSDLQSPIPVPTSLPTPQSVLPTLPRQKLLSGGTQTFQTFNNCGPAALSMALSHYGVNVSQQQLGRELRPYQHPTGDNDDKSVTLAELAAKADKYGLVAYHRPAGTVELIKQLVALDLPVITRTWLNPGEDIGHYRVITGYDDTAQEFIQDDSLQGANLRYTYSAFEELWGPFSYEFLVLVPPEKQLQVEAVLGNVLDETTAWRTALVMAETTLSENPSDVYGAFNRSVALYHLGDYAGAIAAYEAVAAQLPPRILWYQIEPILAYWKRGDQQIVLQLADQILNRQNRAYSELYYLKGVIYQDQGNQTAADQAFAQADSYNATGSWRVNIF